MNILALVNSDYGRRHVENIRKHQPESWKVEVWEAASIYPPMIDDPQDYLPTSFSPADLILQFGEHKGVAELLPEIATMSSAKAVIAAIDNEAYLPPGLAQQLRGWLERSGVTCVTPKPLCSLTETHYWLSRREKIAYDDPFIREFAHYFGMPAFDIQIDKRTRRIASIRIVRDAVCGCARFVGERLVGLSVDEAEQEAGMLHHHYPCLAAMGVVPDYNDTLMHVSGNILRAAVAEQIKTYKAISYLTPGSFSETKEQETKEKNRNYPRNTAMTQFQLPKSYDFKTTEPRIYEMWENGGYFQPSNDPHKPDFDPSMKPFVISIPPPNVTGELHLGHVMFVAMEDLMIRYHRMKGIPTLWVPGTDHAGIATQLQVEKDLLRTEEVTREELGREKFLERAWAWKVKYHSIITEQIRKIGASCDWSRERFTLDDGLSKAVREAFVRLYEKGLIYRGPRLVNWSPGLKTAVSDLEVEYSEEPGKLYYFKYMLAGSETEYIPVATTRPETILGDTALAVHPEDKRYKKFIGKKVLVPILGREIPVITDEYVDREFGTGALKITPGHDPNDYEIGQRHKLPILSMLDRDAKVTEVGGKYHGLDRFVCRDKLWADMKAAGLIIKEEPYTLNVPRSQRGGEIVEPMISTQWFVKIQPLAKAALKVVREGKIKIVPQHFEKIYYNWLKNIKDWCISRQLWWGHRIPVWYCADCGKQTCARTDPSACAHCSSKNIQQDADVLDTWFSSGLWPFSTLGWPDEKPDYKYFYPTSIMETGYDILFFWVARMIMMGLEFTGEVPFRTVYLHGLIRDEQGRKMSKSYGNVVDPLPVMDKYGTDALRFTLLVGSAPGSDMNLSLKRVESNRNFANKLWNAGRFVIAALERMPNKPEKDAQWTLADSWIWARRNQLVRDVERLFESYQYGEAGRQIYEFFWGDFADWYVEIAKLQLGEGGDRAFYTAKALVDVLDTCLRLLHPFTPFVTEQLWSYLKQACLQHPSQYNPESAGGKWEQALIIARWPEAGPIADFEAASIADFALLQDTIRSIRNLRTEKLVKPSRRIPAIIAGWQKTSFLKEQAKVIAVLAGLDESKCSIVESLSVKPENSIATVIGPVEIYLPLAGMVDLDEESSRLKNELEGIQVHIIRLEKLLASDFARKAPVAVVQKEREKLAAYQETAAKIRAQLD